MASWRQEPSADSGWPLRLMNRATSGSAFIAASAGESAATSGRRMSRSVVSVGIVIVTVACTSRKNNRPVRCRARDVDGFLRDMRA